MSAADVAMEPAGPEPTKTAAESTEAKAPLECHATKQQSASVTLQSRS